MSILDDMAALVREAGQIVLSARDIWAHTLEKTSAADLVTEYDEAVEAFLKERLPKLLPGSQFFGEEEAENCDPSRGWVFIVDPIDGTTNFLHMGNHYAISLGAYYEGKPVFGWVYDAAAGELEAELRKTLRHELRHHMEALAGDNALEIEDLRALQAYLRRYEDD